MNGTHLSELHIDNMSSAGMRRIFSKIQRRKLAYEWILASVNPTWATRDTVGSARKSVAPGELLGRTHRDPGTFAVSAHVKKWPIL